MKYKSRNERAALIVLTFLVGAGLQAVFVPSAIAKVSKAREKVFVLHQKHNWLGRVIVYCNDAHVRVSSLDSEAAIVANAPDWLVQIYDPKRKLLYEVPKQKFFRSGFTGPMQSTGLVMTKLTLVKQGDLAKMPGTCYKFMRRTNNQSGVYWILRSGLTGTACQILQALYMAPMAAGVPLALETKNLSAKPGSENSLVFSVGAGTELSTANCESGTVARSAFNYVSGYKKAPYATDVLVNKKLKDDLETGMTEFGEALGKTK
jgi:hypothetical protein